MVMNRREWMAQSLAFVATAAWSRGKAAAMNISTDAGVREAVHAFDHILLGTADLEEGIRWMEQRTGVRAKVGGSHPGRGTRNALLSLGKLQYLEIIAPDPAQPGVHDGYGLEKLASPRIVQWAVHTDDIAGSKRAAEGAGVKTIGPEPGSRQLPDGKMLRWQTLGIEQSTPLVPFFIQWEQGSQHPSTSSPLAGTAKSLRFETPQPDELNRILQGVGIRANIRKSDSARIVLEIETAKGRLEIS
jgi:hypothetical protein